jgi:hypothetical protein
MACGKAFRKTHYKIFQTFYCEAFLKNSVEYPSWNQSYLTRVKIKTVRRKGCMWKWFRFDLHQIISALKRLTSKTIETTHLFWRHPCKTSLLRQCPL